MWLEQNALMKIELAPSSNCIATSVQALDVLDATPV
jgi:hypothetical protein